MSFIKHWIYQKRSQTTVHIDKNVHQKINSLCGPRLVLRTQPIQLRINKWQVSCIKVILWIIAYDFLEQSNFFPVQIYEPPPPPHCGPIYPRRSWLERNFIYPTRGCFHTIYKFIGHSSNKLESTLSKDAFSFSGHVLNANKLSLIPK